MKTDYFKKVYIKSEDDLPVKEDRYFVGHKLGGRLADWFIPGHERGNKYWLDNYAWYLLPVTLPSDEEIEEMLWEKINISLSQKDKIFNTDAYKQYQETLYWMRWMRDDITAK